jgi:hypothetical protein
MGLFLKEATVDLPNYVAADVAVASSPAPVADPLLSSFRISK